jgi:hypothetical protein
LHLEKTKLVYLPKQLKFKIIGHNKIKRNRKENKKSKKMKKIKQKRKSKPSPFVGTGLSRPSLETGPGRRYKKPPPNEPSIRRDLGPPAASPRLFLVPAKEIQNVSQHPRTVTVRVGNAGGHFLSENYCEQSTVSTRKCLGEERATLMSSK